MSKVVSMPKSLDDAIGTALVAIEKNDFKKVIKLLEYVKTYKTEYDEVMVNYALLISYMNTGQLDKANDVIAILDETTVNNPQVASVLKSIKKDLANQQTVEASSQDKEIQNLTYEQIIQNLNLTDRLNIIAEKYQEVGPNTIWSQLINPSEIEDLRSNYNVYMNQFSKWKLYIVNFQSFNSEFSPLDVYEFLKEIEDDEFFWLNFNFTHLEVILNNKNLHQFVKNYVLEKLAYYTKEKILPIYNIRLAELDGEISTIDLPIYEIDKSDIINRITSFYELDTKYDSDTIETMVGSILDVIGTMNYPNNIYDGRIAIDSVVAYIVNDIFLGREYDVTVKAKTSISFEDVKEEIKKYEQLISYLIT